MIDDFIIFERGGSVLWRRSFVGLRGDPIATLIREVLLEDRASDAELQTSSYGVRWNLSNEHRLVIAVVYQRLLPPAYASDLLNFVKSSFTKQYSQQLQAREYDTPDFDAFHPTFDKLLHKAEQASLRKAREAREARRAEAIAGSQTQTNSTNSNSEPPPSNNSEADEVTAETDTAGENGIEEAALLLSPTSESAEDETRRNREAFIRKRSGGKKKPQVAPADTSTKVPKRGKVMRPSKNSASDGDVTKLDYSLQPTGDTEEAEVAKVRQQFKDGAANSGYDLLDVSDEEDESDGKKTVKRSTLSGGVFNYFQGLAGMRALTREDLQPALDKFREALIGKNVAQEIADRLLESVCASLEGRQMESMTTVSSTVRKSLEEALTRILTSKQSTDILSDIESKKGSGRPYVITYCGVNGVGKSTSLAKTCYFLLDNGYRVLIAACDTFRAGAVEQLRTHVRCLGNGVELFDRGYGKDAAAVANEAIRQATREKFDVVLVDTAGRMQDNEPLMKALAKLVEVNRPDRLFFVGEALVGNDAVDQLKKFNSALSDNQTSASPRLIDGIVLTKFDTIDDKVGAAVSMVYTTGQPIVFVGVGQTYMDLRKMNTKALVRALLR